MYGNISLVAHFEANTYAVTLDSDGGECVTNLLTVTYDSPYTLPIPTKAGYIFNGWYNGSTKVEAGVWNRTYSLDLKAKWSIANYTISYNLNGGVNNENNPISFTFETDTITLLDASKTGYTFIGWTSDVVTTPTKNVTIEKGSYGNVTFKANFVANKYNVTFDVNSGDELENNELEVTYGTSYNLPKPTKTGYEFMGWYNGDELVSDGTWEIDNTVNLMAEWQIKTYTINYILNGGVNNNSNLQSYNYEYNDITILDPSKTGYSFNGWKVNDSETLVTDYVIKHNSIGNVTLEAIFISNEYSYKLDVNGGEELDVTEFEISYDEKFTLPIVTRPGYTFNGWYKGSNKVEGGTWKYLEDVTFTAKWTIINYTITYNLDGGTNNSANVTKYNFESEDITILEPTKKGYTFIGWTNEDIIVPTKEYIINHNSTGNVTLNANFQVNTYYITYDVNGGNELEEDFIGVVYGTSYTLVTPTREGYEFSGWYNGSNKVNNGTWLKDNDLTLTAKWTLVNYTISYILDGGKNNSYNPAKYNYEYQDIVISNPIKTGYTFIGWSVNDGEELYVDYVIKQHSFGNLVLKANWKVNVYKLSLDINGGDELDQNEFNIEYGTNYSLPEPSRIGYTFAGWYNGTTKVESGTWKYLEYITLTAEWNIIYFNINYELNGGVNYDNPYTYTYDDETIVLSDVYKEGHTFVGWITDNIFVPTKALEIPHNSLGEFSFEAIFEANTYLITFDVNGGDQLDINEMEVVYGEYVELPIPTNGSYTFAGWDYEGETIESGIWEVEGSFALKARWINIYAENGRVYVDLGRYPQTVVTDSNIISKLNNITTTNSLGYIEYNGEEYKKVTASIYGSDYTFINGNSITNGSTYYFKVEPIKWRVLQNTNGTYKLLSEYILDNMYYYVDTNNRTVNGSTVYANNYMYSNVRAWLNGLNGSSYNVTNYTGKGFLDMAFTEAERNFINTTLVNNSASTTSNSSNSFTCNITNDKIYLLSYKDALNTSYGFNSSSSNYDTARKAIVSDYARSKGCYMSTSSSNYGNGDWWLCSPYYDDSYYASCVNGRVHDRYYVYYSSNGVRPALEITI